MSIASRALHGINVCVIPSPYNNDRPLVLRHKPLAFVSALLIATKVLALTIWALTPATAELSTITVDRIVQLTNEERVKVGQKPLAVNSKLAAAAQKKGEDMLAHDYFAHISPTGVTPWFWINQQGYSYEVAGENLAIDFTQAEDVVAAWIASPSHKENMLRPDYTETGVAVVTGEFQGGTSTIVVHMFGKPIGAAAETVESEPTALPTATPTPAPEESTAPTPTPDTTAPGVPRIALAGGTANIGTSATVEIKGDSDSVAHVLINNQVRAEVPLDGSGAGEIALDVHDVPDGDLVLRAYSSDAAGNSSSLSDPLVVTKDTAGPTASSDQVSFLLPPAFDANGAAVTVSGSGYAQVDVTQQGVRTPVPSSNTVFVPTLDDVTVAFSDARGNTTTIDPIHLRPQFSFDPSTVALDAPQAFTVLSRRLMAAILVAMVGLLCAAVFIRIRIQHPALIMHASIVILLAAVLFIL